MWHNGGMGSIPHRATGSNQYRSRWDYVNLRHKFPKVSIPLSMDTSDPHVHIGECDVNPLSGTCSIHSDTDEKCVLHRSNCSYVMNQINPEIPEILAWVFRHNITALAEHPDVKVRKLVADNPGCDPDTRQLLLRDISAHRERNDS